ncbi:response regulator transcription factor FixJ [Phenylobacterium sp. J426]|uniref:response regulator FixJ n=1 Tax=Phenylobacterium sp. J426 TaxID=2898439 RepID=UPI002151F56D|nr:response regulator FixJ [Phenylobacterium sp. J426]MCR5876171.1 response regulator transcription factor FixJ [Phenylobacterium sp. J426]
MSSSVVHVIDDDEAMRQSLEFLLDTAGYAARTYESGPQFLQHLPGLEHGCILTDVRMPDMNGLELVRRLQTHGVTLPVIVLTGHGDVPLAVEAMKAGVRDFLEKPFDDEVLLAAVASAMDSGDQAQKEDAERQKFETMLSALSPREKDVLHGVVAGKPNKVIAHELGISPRTVEVYRANVMTKTGAGSLSDLVRMALLARF